MTTMHDGDYVPAPSGHRLFARDWGKGPPILFLAGAGMTSDCWGGVMSLVADSGYRAIAYDRRGHGRSSDPGPADLHALAGDLHRVLDYLDLERVVLVAHSGAAGEVARYVSMHGSARLAGAAFVASTGPCMMRHDDNPDGLDPDLLFATIAQMGDDLPGWIERNEASFTLGSRRSLDWVAGMLLACSRRTLLAFQRSVATADLRSEFAGMGLPTLVVHGDLDHFAPIDLTGRRIASIVPGARLEIYRGAGHWPMLTHAGKLAQDIMAHADRSLAFLSEKEQACSLAA